jgi:hypothetical protein
MIREIERFVAQWVVDHGSFVGPLADRVLAALDSLILGGVYLAGMGWLIRVLSSAVKGRDSHHLRVGRLAETIVRLAITIVLGMAGVLLAVGRAAGRSHYRW